MVYRLTRCIGHFGKFGDECYSCFLRSRCRSRSSHPTQKHTHHSTIGSRM